MSTKEKFRLCPRCKAGKLMSDELRRGYNAKSKDGTQICSDCKVAEILEGFSL